VIQVVDAEVSSRATTVRLRRNRACPN
jgi:hypothetical protein